MQGLTPFSSLIVNFNSKNTLQFTKNELLLKHQKFTNDEYREVNTIKNIIKDLRIAKGLTQAEMAEKLGYSSKSGYCQLENGTVKMTIEKALLIAKALNVDPSIFFEEKLHAS